MRRHGLVIVGALALATLVAASAGAKSTPKIRAEQARERTVMAQVNELGKQLQRVEDRAWNAQQRLAQVKQSLDSNTRKLHAARASFHAAQQRIAERIYSLYVSGKPTTLDVLAGAHSLSQVIDRAEAAQTLSQQDAALGRGALEFKHAVQHRQDNLQVLKARRARAVLRLASQKRQIESVIAQQQQLLASIHSSIHKLQVQEAARERREAAAAAARLRAQIAAQQAAAAAAAQQQQPTQTFPLPPVLSGAGHPDAARIALQYLGVPYVWGGASPSGFDCSGLVMYVYAQLGISLPHYTVSQWNATSPVSLSAAQPGDLIFFNGLEHVGIYLGGGQMVDAPHTGAVVRVESIYGFGSIDGARRVP